MVGFDQILKNFSAFDFNGDGINEINSLTLFNTAWGQEFNDADNILLVIINNGLLEKPTHKYWFKQFQKSIGVLRTDLINDGYKPCFITADVYSGPAHQDGLTVLAIRKFFQAVKAMFPYFKGAIFVGSFPEAFLVRTYLRTFKAGYDEKAVEINGHKVEGEHYLRIWPDEIATRSDLVLCDLDGNWDQIYHEGATKLPTLIAVPSHSKLFGGLSQLMWGPKGCKIALDVQDDSNYDYRFARYETGTKEFSDFFHLNDTNFKINKKITDYPFFPKAVVTELEIEKESNAEVSSGDLSSPNPIAIPEIIVSRIDAKHIAISPDRNFKGKNGESLLDQNGVPQEVETSAPVDVLSLFVYDKNLELSLIVEYLERNHRHREKSRQKDIRYDAIAGPEFTKSGILNEAFSFWFLTDSDPPDGASLSDYVRYLRKPPLIRFITTHASPSHFMFKDLSIDRLYDDFDLSGLKGEELEKTKATIYEGLKNSPLFHDMIAAMEKEKRILDSLLGAKPERWFWDEAKGKLCPGWERNGGSGDIYVHKALWKSGMKYDWGRFYFTSSCDVITPTSYNLVAYDAPNYAPQQLGETLLFYCGGLALLARAKTFNDLPPNIGSIFVYGGKRFGEIWREYFNSDKQDNSLYSKKNGIKRKRAYFWGIIGDWTLKAAYNK